MLCDNATSQRNSPFSGNKVICNTFQSNFHLAGSVLKAVVKRKITEPAIQREIYNRSGPINETPHNRRMHEVESCLPVFTVQKCADFFHYVMGYMPACLHQEDLTGWAWLTDLQIYIWIHLDYIDFTFFVPTFCTTIDNNFDLSLYRLISTWNKNYNRFRRFPSGKGFTAKWLAMQLCDVCSLCSKLRSHHHHHQACLLAILLN